MSVTYLTTPIVEVRNDPPPRGSGMTRDGYTKRSGAPTARMVRLQGEKRWRRLMVWQFSNMGTMFVNLNGKPHVVREEDIPRESASSAHSTRKHATKKSPAQLQREIDEALAGTSSSAIRLPPGEPAAWAHRHLSKAKTPAELADIWRAMKKPGTGMGAYYGSRTGIAQSEINSVYQQHRARLGAA